MKPRRLPLLLIGVWVLGCISNARADDTFIVRGVALTAPNKGWGLQEKGPISNLVNVGAPTTRPASRPSLEATRIEVFRVAQVPPAQTQAFARWLRDLQTTHPAEMQITKAAEHEQQGLKGILAEGTAKDADGKPLLLRIVVLPVGDRAVVARAIIREEDADRLQKQVEEILASMKPR